MEATTEQIEMLDKLQEVDRLRLKAERELAQLPHREQVVELRKRKKGVQEKLVQVQDVISREEKRISRIELEDQQLVEKQRKTQEKIDGAKGDYRAVNTWTRDLEGMMKRRNTLDSQLSSAMEKLGEIEKVRDQAQSVLAKLDAQEGQIVAHFQKDSSKLAEDIEKCKAVGQAIASKIPRELLELYVSAVKRCGGVGLAHLKDMKCSACRNVIDQNRFLQLRREAPLSECPHCHRILVIDEDDG